MREQMPKDISQYIDFSQNDGRHPRRSIRSLINLPCIVHEWQEMESRFRDVATTNQERIQYDDGGVARYVWLRSPHANGAYSEYNIAPGGASYSNYAHFAYAFQPAMCIA